MIVELSTICQLFVPRRVDVRRKNTFNLRVLRPCLIVDEVEIFRWSSYGANRGRYHFPLAGKHRRHLEFISLHWNLNLAIAKFQVCTLYLGAPRFSAPMLVCSKCPLRTERSTRWKYSRLESKLSVLCTGFWFLPDACKNFWDQNCWKWLQIANKMNYLPICFVQQSITGLWPRRVERCDVSQEVPPLRTVSRYRRNLELDGLAFRRSFYTERPLNYLRLESDLA